MSDATRKDEQATAARGPEAPASKSDTAPSDLSATIEAAGPSEPAATIDPASGAQSGPGADAPRGALAPTLDFSLDTPDPPATVSALDQGARPADETAPPTGQPAVAGYELLGELGRGGMGVVYRARQAGLNRLVALKMVLAGAHAGAEQLARFHTEAEAVAALQHPNIVQVYEVGEHQGLPYFSLEFVDGGSLDKKLAGKPQPPREAAQLTETLARAMHYAHRHGIVHRDLKPANVLVSADGVPKITDFGLAKKLEGDSGQTKSGTLMGTPNYMAPEQARGDTKEAGPLADVHALGAMLYKMLTGRPPFLAATLMETVMQVIHDEPMPPRRLLPKLPCDLETISLKCLQKELHKRYESALALADDLRRFLNGEPILARPVSAPERLWRWCQRNKRVAALSFVVLLLLFSLAIGSTTAFVLVSRQKAIAVQNEGIAKEARGKAEQNELKAVAAQTAADENAKIAGQQRTLALEALRTLIFRVQEQLQDKPAMQSLKQSLLETAMDGLNRVAASVDKSTLADVSMASAHRKLGDIYFEMGQTNAALEQYQFCQSIVEALAKQAAPQDPVPKRNLATSFNNLGETILRLGDAAKARDYFLRALAQREAWLALDPGQLDPKKEIADSYGRLGRVALLLGDPVAARDHYNKALGLRAEWVAREPGNDVAKRELAGAHSTMGDVSLQLGETAAALDYYRQSLDVLESQAAVNQESQSARWNVAILDNKLGEASLLARDSPAAKDHYRRALEQLHTLSAQDPQNAKVKRDLSVARYGLATACLRLGEVSADQHYRESLKLREALLATNPQDVRSQIDLMLVLARCGEHLRAAEAAASLRAGAPHDPRILYNVACCYSLCVPAVAYGKAGQEPSADDQALVQHYGQTAVEALAQAIAAGYKGLALVSMDPDLDPVRGRPDYLRLLEHLVPTDSSTAAQ